MNDDIVPELLKSITNDFDDKLLKSSLIKSKQKLLSDGKATYIDANDYAVEIGEILKKSFEQNISPATLPYERMYFNIAERLLNTTLSDNHKLVSDYATKVQDQLNQQAGVNLKTQIPSLNQDRIDGLVNRISSEESFKEIQWILGEPIINFTQNIINDFVSENAGFQYKTGLKPKITRKVVGKACKWCQSLSGSYNYPDVPDDIYRRHERCRCMVDYNPGDGKKQNVWSKVWKNSDENDKIELRKQIGSNVFANSTPAPFARAVEIAKAGLNKDIAWRVTAYEPEHYVGSKLHVSQGGSTVAISSTGDIISVCRADNDNVRGTDLLKLAVENGGTKLDSYAGNHLFYTKNGFEPISWCKWDGEYAPEGWNGKPENIIFYKYTGNSKAELKPDDFYKRVSASSDYDEAEKIRNEAIGGKS
ncbi:MULTISPECIES: hypothetical protein [unclassified Lactococcus]|uniref:hypothetical protein n=1 Tax=unclassified Lactococcus TaxID=2643510 RepID=UPI00164EE24A|nr:MULTISPECIES: hypothetical protein [unclassified Lactococcus]